MAEIDQNTQGPLCLFDRMPKRIRSCSLLAAWQFSLLTAILTECSRLHRRLLEQGTIGAWGEAPAHDGTWFVPLLLLAPFCWGFPTSFRFASRSMAGLPTSRLTEVSLSREWKRSLLASLLIGAVSLAAGEFTIRQVVPGSRSGEQIRDTLPLVQDEFSYLLQARGILEGRWDWPGPMVAAELFHQLHVLNEGRFGSRYFPGTGLWIAPWLAVGHPEWAPRIAGGLISAGMFWLGSELAGTAAGWIAGLATALAPGMAVFNHLCLSHQPGLVGIVLFLIFFIRLMRTGALLDAVLSGGGLSMAMLCRPLTAAAIGLPFGIWLAGQGVHLIRGKPGICLAPANRLLRITAMLGLPLLQGLIIMGSQNMRLTGSVFVTPYQRYTELYTPRHAFGFHQVSSQEFHEVNARQRQSAYDDWALDLSFSRAIQNSLDRWRGSLSWGLGLVPMMLTVLLILGTLPWQSAPVQLLTTSLFCLHLVHLPYWLNGMLEHHYVFEADLLCLLLLGVASVEFLCLALRQGRLLFPLWWAALLGLSFCINWVPMGPGGESRVTSGWRPFLQATSGYRAFETALRQQSFQKPVLVLVTPGPGDLHVQFVRNQPPFDADLLTGTARPDLYSIDELSALFPERTLAFYDSATRQFTTISPSQPDSVEVKQ